MRAEAQIDDVGADVMRRRKWIMIALIIAGLIAGVLASREAEDWVLLFFAGLIVTYPAIYALRFHRFERLLNNSETKGRLKKYFGLKSSNFNDARGTLEAEGSLIDFDKMVMASPSTWNRRQGIARFDCEPFEVMLIEKNERVGEVQVFVKGAK